MPMIEDMPIESYHSHLSYSKTDLVHAERSTQYVKDMRLNPKDQSPAQAMGTAVHMLLLEPDKAEHELVTIEAGVRRGKVYDQALIDHPHSTILLRKEWDDIEPMMESGKQHPFGEHLGKGPAEASFFCDLQVEDMTLPVKCRPDLLPYFDQYLESKRFNDQYRIDHPDEEIPDPVIVIIDLKTARDVTQEGFGRAALNYHYHWSAWLTKKIIEIETGLQSEYYFMAIENNYPHETVIYRAMPWDIELAELEIEPVLYSLAKAHCRDEWREIEPQGVVPLSLPKWAFTRRGI